MTGGSAGHRTFPCSFLSALTAAFRLASGESRESKAKAGREQSNLWEVNMRRLLLAGLVSTLAAGCASNKAADEPGARIRDTTATPRDTVNPNDTLPHIRDSLPDSTQPR
jgi:hypothetical protein